MSEPLSAHAPANAVAARIPTLDGWRAVAVVSVILSHSKHLVAPQLESLLATLRVGVDLFFAISGFLITTLLLQGGSSDRGAQLRSFYVRRAFRILPLICTYLTVLATLDWFWVDIVERWEFLSTFFFCRNYLMHWPGGAATNHFWSLSVEEHFYLIWPPILLWLGRSHAARVALGTALCVALW